MAASTLLVTPTPAETTIRMEALRAESRRLRTELVRANLDICLTIAMFSDAKPSCSVLHEACRRAAARGMEAIERLVPQAAEKDLPDVHGKMERLRAYVAGLPAADSPESAKPSGKHAVRGEGPEMLTRRELEVLRHIAEGNSTKQVADLLGITFKTAACHRYRVMDKLGIHETANLVRYAIRHGMVQA